MRLSTKIARTPPQKQLAALGELWEALGEPWGALTELWEALGELWEGPWQIPQKHLKVKEQKSHHWALEQRLEFNSGATLHGISLRFFSKTPKS